eukprot:CAMPEP_0195292522 /NCGR_PEP_ID=MMETSP0707-20130614/9923_1 /TAXON_ID=33640 /ORGANISM="Asterionellopsis glacialis, Strain CCMP134" /LENGTH=272 /DNA_ID=CAMNT_0040353003 /DNA_START=64 /DNA_END=882 /DNA_ORIENTATION=-
MEQPCGTKIRRTEENRMPSMETSSQFTMRTIQRKLLPRRRSFPRTKDLSPLIKTSGDVGLSRLLNELEMSEAPEDDFFLLAPEEATLSTSSETTQQRLLPRRRSAPTTPIDSMPCETLSPLPVPCEPVHQWKENSILDSKSYVTPPISSTIVQRRPIKQDMVTSKIENTSPVLKRSDSDELSQISDKLEKAGVPRDEFFLMVPGEVNREYGNHISNNRVVDMRPLRTTPLEKEEQESWIMPVSNQQQANDQHFFSPILTDDGNEYSDQSTNC